jgi:branched-chain amino acid transport system substrate-binding protein
VFSVYGYNLVDIFAEAATQAGKNLTSDTFVKAMETMKIPNDIFGSPAQSFGPNKRLGSNETRLSQLQSERWVVVSPYSSLKK